MQPIFSGRTVSSASTSAPDPDVPFDVHTQASAPTIPQGQHRSVGQRLVPGERGTITNARQIMAHANPAPVNPNWIDDVSLQPVSMWEDTFTARLMSNACARHFLFTGFLDQEVSLQDHKEFLDRVIKDGIPSRDINAITAFNDFVDGYKTQIMKDYFSRNGKIHPEFSIECHQSLLDKAENSLSTGHSLFFDAKFVHLYRASLMGIYFQKYHCIYDRISLQHHMEYVLSLRSAAQKDHVSWSFKHHSEEYRAHFMAFYYQKTQTILHIETPKNHLKAIRYMKALAVDCHQDNQKLIEDYTRAVAVDYFQYTGKILKELNIDAHRTVLGQISADPRTEKMSPDMIESYQRQVMKRYFQEKGDLAPEFSLEQHVELVAWHIDQGHTADDSPALMESYRLTVCDAVTQPLYLVQPQDNWRAALEEI